jgi:hypothetical protein
MASAAPAAAPLQRERPSTGGGKRSEERVCVAVNIRPLIDIELEQGCQECLFVAPGMNQVRRRHAVVACPWRQPCLQGTAAPRALPPRRRRSQQPSPPGRQCARAHAARR